MVVTILRSAKIGYRAVYGWALNYCNRENSVGALPCTIKRHHVLARRSLKGGSSTSAQLSNCRR